jgi:hypothetical protein
MVASALEGGLASWEEEQHEVWACVEHAAARERPSRAAQVLIASCVDSFTGSRIPYPVIGTARSSGSFEVSSTATIAAAVPDIVAAANATSPPAFAFSRLTSASLLGLDLEADSPYDVLASGKVRLWQWDGMARRSCRVGPCSSFTSAANGAKLAPCAYCRCKQQCSPTC